MKHLINYSIALVLSLASFGQTPTEMMNGFYIGMKRTECEKLLKEKHTQGMLVGQAGKMSPQLRKASEVFSRTLTWRDQTLEHLQLNVEFKYKVKGMMNKLVLEKVIIYMHDQSRFRKVDRKIFGFSVNPGLQEELKALFIRELDERGWKYMNVKTQSIGGTKLPMATLLLE